MDEILYMIFLNVALFGSLYVLGKSAEKLVWYYIDNYEEIQKRFTASF